MGHGEANQGQSTRIQNVRNGSRQGVSEDFVLDKSIFNNIFDKDIRRVFIYKKTERLAKALHLVAPAFADSRALKERIDSVAIAMVDAATLPPGIARTALSRELLLLSSLLGVARTGGILSAMNADIIAREAHTLLQEVAVYEEPRIFLDDAPTLSELAKDMPKKEAPASEPRVLPTASALRRTVRGGALAGQRKGQALKDTGGKTRIHIKDRQDAILSVIRTKGSVSIKDISTLIRDVSEKTIQRELISLVAAGSVTKRGERRWSVYSLSS